MNFREKRFEVKIVDHEVHDWIPEFLCFEVFDHKRYNQKKNPHAIYTRDYHMARRVSRYLNVVSSLDD
jgi:hypothetical protein